MGEKRIELERRGKSPSQIEELNLDNARATQIEGLSDEYVNLESLSLINVGLTTLKGFPKLPKLKRLELSDNRISNGLGALQDCPMLSHLNLSNNKIKDLEAIEPLKSFDQLTHLDLFNNDICNLDDYRTKVFKLLPNLKYLDDTDADDNDEEESDEGEEGANGAEEEDEGEADDDDGEEDGEEEESDDDEDDEEDGEMTLSDLYNKKLDDDEDGEDFVEGDEEEDDDEIDDEDEPSTKKPKVDNDGDAN